VPREERQHRADALHDTVWLQTLLEPGTTRLELLVDGGISQPPQHGDARRGREWVPRERACLVHAPGRGQLGHHVRPSAERRERKTTAHDLAEDRQVRKYAEPLLGAAAGDTKSCDHLVEDEERTARVAQLPQGVEETRFWRNDTHVPRHRLDDDRSKAFSV